MGSDGESGYIGGMMYKILDKKKLNDTVELMEIKAPFVARRCEPGQFVILRIEENGERIPLTIADFDRKKESVTIIYQVVGYSTGLLSKKSIGDDLLDFAGPMGKATELKAHKRVLGIGGGVGTAPLYPQLKKLHEMGVEVDVIIGGRSKDFLILEEELSQFCSHVYKATNDGSAGTQGFVTDVLQELIDGDQAYDEVIAIGPVMMMKAVVDLTHKYQIPTGVSLNPIMIDGTGMCGGCRVTIGGVTKFACVDGPDFNGFDVDFDELINRQGYYVDKENHKCRMHSQEATL